MRVLPAIQVLSQRLGRAPTTAEIAAELDIDAADVARAVVVGNAYRPESIDLPGYDNDDRTLSDTLSRTDTRLDLVEESATVAPLIAVLSDRDRQVLSLRFFESQTQTQIAAKLGISQMQVSRILTAILTTLRSQLRTIQ